MSTSIRRALLTALPVGKAFASSGSINTRFVPAVARWKYFPRTPGPRAEKSYSGLRSSDRFLACFAVRICLFSRRLPSADDPNPITAVKMRNKDNPTPTRFASGDVPALPFRMVGILVGHGQRIKEYRGRLREGDAVLPEIPCGLARIPFVNHRPSLPPAT